MTNLPTTTINVKTDAGDLVHVSIDQANITGTIPVSATISSVTITDIDTTGRGQTSDLIVSEHDRQRNWRNNRECKCITFVNEHLSTNNLKMDMSGQALAHIVMNLDQIGGNSITTGNGANANAQKVVNVSDNDDIPKVGQNSSTGTK